MLFFAIPLKYEANVGCSHSFIATTWNVLCIPVATFPTTS